VIRTVRLALNAFPAVPPGLCTAAGGATDTIEVNLSDLYTYYYLDSWGVRPPDPDPAHFEHVRHLMPGRDFRFAKNGMGIAKTFKGNKSNELGQAFCRWFLSTYLDTPYHAHIEHVRDHGALVEFGGASVETTPNSTGDAPDYLCATASNDLSLAEAKGTGHAVGFSAKEFQSWRDQFDRVRVRDATGDLLSVKGYIVAMRWASELDSAKVRTTLSAEDPATPGERSVGDEGRGLSYAVKSIHYSSSLQRLRQPLLAAALLRGFRLPGELQFRVVVWQCMLPPLDKLKFAGGFFPKGADGVLPYQIADGKLIHTPNDPLRLDISSGTFFGIELGTLQILAATARVGPGAIEGLRPLEPQPAVYSGLSYLVDGHILGPIEFFRPVQTIDL